MRKFSSTITQRGQVTLPVEIRRKLDVNPGDRVEFTIEGDQVTVRPVKYTLESAFGSVPPLSEPMDFEEMIRTAKEDRAERLMRKLQDDS